MMLANWLVSLKVLMMKVMIILYTKWFYNSSLYWVVAPSKRKCSSILSIIQTEWTLLNKIQQFTEHILVFNFFPTLLNNYSIVKYIATYWVIGHNLKFLLWHFKLALLKNLKNLATPSSDITFFNVDNLTPKIR